MSATTPGPAKSGTTILHLPYETPPLLSIARGVLRAHLHAEAKTTAQIRSAVYAQALIVHLPRNVGLATVTLHYRPAEDARSDDDREADVKDLRVTAEPIYDALVNGTTAAPGYGLCKDPDRMMRAEPQIHAAVEGYKGRLWVTVFWEMP